MQPFGSGNGGSSTVSLVQVRAKSNRLRPKDQGVVVRLLEDIPKFGRRGNLSASLMFMPTARPLKLTTMFQTRCSASSEDACATNGSPP